VLTGGVALFLAAYLGLAVTGASLVVLAGCFVAAGVAIGCVETAEHAAVATAALAALQGLRGSAFGLLAAVQSLGNLAASGVAGLLWAFAYLAGWMALALVGLARAGTGRGVDLGARSRA
jgi:hypothetical protein